MKSSRVKSTLVFATGLCLAVGMTLCLTVTAYGVPTVGEGFEVEKYADVAGPFHLAFDGDGNLFAGRHSGSPSNRIHKISPGGGTVVEFGSVIDDPDGVIVDIEGNVASEGYILVGGLLQNKITYNSRITKISPDGLTTSILVEGSPPEITNPQQLAFDADGNLLFVNCGSPTRVNTVGMFDGTNLSVFGTVDVNTCLGGIAIDPSDGRVFVSDYERGKIKVLDSEGNLMHTDFVTDLSKPDAMAFDPTGQFGDRLFVVERGTGKILSIDPSTGEYEVFASGIAGPFGLAFGPDECLYVSEYSANKIWRICSAADVTPPVITCPANVTLEADENCQVIYTGPPATAEDETDPNPVVTSDPELPATFTGVDDHTITWTATDASGNSSTCDQTITVEDVTAPNIQCPDDVIISADEDCEATVELTATAADNCDDSPEITNDAPAGNVYPLGTTTVTFTATDGAGNESSCPMTVTVVDDTFPDITCPQDVTVVYPGAACKAEVELTVEATDNCDDDPEITSNAPEGNIYPIGETTVTFTATDDARNSFECNATVMVLALVDIKPGSCPNPLNVKSRGVLPAAILGCEGFDVGDIDPASILLEGVSPIRDAVEDVATLMEDEPCECTNAGADGFDDLTLKFDTQEIVNALGDVSDGQEVVLTLTGELTDGMAIKGEDCVIIKKKPKGGPAMVVTSSSAPIVFDLSQNNPNPFTRETSISYTLPASGHTTLKVYDTSGRLVKTLVDTEMSAGVYSVTWDRKSAASGVYFYKLISNGDSLTRKMVVLR